MRYGQGITVDVAYSTGRSRIFGLPPLFGGERVALVERIAKLKDDSSVDTERRYNLK
jgi:hypothetical protein